MNENDLIQRRSKAPEEISVYQRNISEIPMHTYTYRFLDEDNQPYFRLYVESVPGNSMLYDHLKSQNQLSGDHWTNYELNSGVLLVDNLHRTIHEKETTHTFSQNPAGGVYSAFDMYYQKDASRMIVASNLQKKQQMDQEELSEEIPFETSVKGIGKKEVDFPEPLETEKLSMSDLILGYDTRENEEPPSNSDALPFRIAHERAIPQGEDLNLYYEVYNLKQDDGSGLARFTFKYDITSVRKGLNKLFGRAEDELSITINNETDDDRYRNVLIIDTSELERGEYEINIELTDQKSAATLDRKVRFSIQ